MAPAGLAVARVGAAALVAVGAHGLGLADEGGARCWSGAFSAELCCDLQSGPRGDEACWNGEFSFEVCCPRLSARPPSTPQGKGQQQQAAGAAAARRDPSEGWNWERSVPTWAQQAVRLLGEWAVPPMPVIAEFFTREMPELLALASAALRTMKLPTTYAGFLLLSQSEALDLAPPLCALLVAGFLPLALLSGERRPRKDVPEPSESYWLTRLCLLRGLGLCYLCGFLTSAFQHRALWGSKGLEPLNPSFPSGRPTPAFDLLVPALPTVPFDCLLEGISWVGVLLSVLLLWSRFSSCVVPALLWVLYLSIVNLQAPFTYAYGWEWLTCEAGFLAIFLCPLPFGVRFPASSPPPRLVLWLFRWLAFRLLLGAGLSKVGRNSSSCWRELTCTTTHYFTQPIPNPVSWFAHHAPVWVHHVEVAFTFVEQLVLPFLMLIPLKWCRRCAGLAEMLFQLMVVATGNYAWINFIGMVPCISMLDDAVLAWFLPRSVAEAARTAAEAAALHGAGVIRRVLVKLLRLLHGTLCVGLVLFMAYKSKDPIKEMFSAAPWINSYDPWFLMNSQGVFGFINKHRVNLVLEYTHGSKPRDAGTEWKALDFRCLPGATDRLPCLLSPYHSRLDWETWIQTTASMEHLFETRAPPQEYFNRFPNFLHQLVLRILHGDEDAVSLMGVPRSDVYAGGAPPTAIKARFYSYTFTDADEMWQTGHWWKREPLDAVGGIVFEAQQQPMKKSQIRKTPFGRTMALLVGVLGTVLSGAALCGCSPLVGEKSSLLSMASAASALLFFAAAFSSALLADYPKLYNSAVLGTLGRGFGVPRLPSTAWELLRGLITAGAAIAALHVAAATAAVAASEGGTKAARTWAAVRGQALLVAGPALLWWCITM
mmetsp:Transcript_146026/g.466709  ORF Transcript_146026/g.466709 Transcript_146026/m.466709 type:complete len:881 (-) Transcript_146026:6-2648(-)